MNLSMLTLNASFGLNLNVYETNVINILIILFIFGKVSFPFFQYLLFKRRTAVINQIEQSCQTAVEANTKLAEAKRQYAQAELVISQIQQEANTAVENLRKASLEQLDKDIQRLEVSTETNINSQQVFIKTDTLHQLSAAILQKVITDLQNYLTPDVQRNFVDLQILQLRDLK
uniref:ATP synthase F0 subunit b n=1 Tax=Glaucocystis incrassata TaxID=1789788 RepID=A0A3G1IVI8_9EUKA|nr:ATP synthase F0 subunit b [Glaucocystis incrassata]ASQ40076.1 ATP synthase F0 subunit b [Glaucocystis incrassata]